MTAKVLKRSRAKFVSKQIVEQMGITLQELPEKTPDTLSLRQTIEQLRGPIEAALSKGYSYEELVPMLAQQGISIQPSTLKRYVLSGGDRSTRKRPGKTRQSRKKSGDTASVASLEDLAVDLSELAAPEPESEAPAPRKRGRAAAKASSDTDAAESTAEPAKQTRSRRTSTRAASTAKPRSSSTRGGRKKA